MTHTTHKDIVVLAIIIVILVASLALLDHHRMTEDGNAMKHNLAVKRMIMEDHKGRFTICENGYCEHGNARVRHG